MKPARVAAIARKECLHIVRDPLSLLMALAIPALMLLLFGYALTLDVDRVPLVVWDQDRSPASRDLVSRFEGSRYFALRRYVPTYAALEHDLDARLALVGLVVPPDYGRDLHAGRPATVQLLVDGTDSNTANLAIGYAETLVLAHGERSQLELARRRFGRAPDPPLDFQPRVWYNPELRSRFDIVPGLIAVIMMVIAALLTSLTVAREWETGTMEQLIATPVLAGELVAGKLIPYFGLGLLDVALAVLMGEFLFGVPLRGSVLLLFVLATIFLSGALAIGLFFSIVARSQLLASQLAMLATFLPAFLLSGFMYPIRNMPEPIQVITHLIPARYFVHLLRALYLKGAGVGLLAGQALLLLAFGVAMTLLARRKFRKALE
jgi:ABC-2 type transport system permease protein